MSGLYTLRGELSFTAAREALHQARNAGAEVSRLAGHLIYLAADRLPASIEHDLYAQEAAICEILRQEAAICEILRQEEAIQR